MLQPQSRSQRWLKGIRRGYPLSAGGYPLSAGGYPPVPRQCQRIPANGCGWPLFRKKLAGIRVSQRIPAAGRGDGRLEGDPSSHRGTSTSPAGRRHFQPSRYKYLASWKETLSAIEVQVTAAGRGDGRLEGDPSSHRGTGTLQVPRQLEGLPSSC
ncbi:hypothetical protein PGTUg99_015351 [Puccinia graminis f. sp. tritici]|uniref:Uncharacterized protein n=1 Tax=Puccinia graminis f. sp. tritici TaxID=56615 RepID=A0A5B0RMC9_PUCGR|nr:hypothetical protein PGTUg99_015351 [Puccinia graminis f. sp. tritici]